MRLLGRMTFELAANKSQDILNRPRSSWLTRNISVEKHLLATTPKHQQHGKTTLRRIYAWRYAGEVGWRWLRIEAQ